MLNMSLVRHSVTENCQGQICKAFTGLTIGAKMIGGGRSLLRKISSQSDRVGAKFQL